MPLWHESFWGRLWSSDLGCNKHYSRQWRCQRMGYDTPSLDSILHAAAKAHHGAQIIAPSEYLAPGKVRLVRFGVWTPYVTQHKDFKFDADDDSIAYEPGVVSLSVESSRSPQPSGSRLMDGVTQYLHSYQRHLHLLCHPSRIPSRPVMSPVIRQLGPTSRPPWHAIP